DTCISKGHSTFSYAAFTAHMSEGIDKIAVGVLRQPLQRHGPTSGIADEALQLISPMGWNLGLRVQRKAVHTGTPRTGEPRCLALVAKPCAEAPHGLASPLATGDALLHRGRHGARERRLVVPQRIILRGHGGLYACLQIPQPTQLADDALADRLDDRRNVS